MARNQKLVAIGLRAIAYSYDVAAAVMGAP